MYIKESDLKESNLMLERLSNNSFYEYHIDNKEDNIKAVINYYSYICIIINNNIIINDYYYNYSNTTNKLIYDESSYKNIFIVDNKTFEKILSAYRSNKTNKLYKFLNQLKELKTFNLYFINKINIKKDMNDILKDLQDINIKDYLLNSDLKELKTRYKLINTYKINDLILFESISFNKNYKNNYIEYSNNLSLCNDYNYFIKNAGGVLSIE